MVLSEIGSADVAIVGGGIVGSSIAYFLAAEPSHDGRILVVERDPSYRDSATARSWGGIRQQFSTPENVRMSQFGAHFVRSAPERLAVDGERPAIPFHEAGYLFLASARGAAALAENVARQADLGAAVALLDPAGLGSRFPWLSLEGIAAGALGLENEGWSDPYLLLSALKRKARALGVTYLKDEAIAVTCAGGRVRDLRLQESGTLPCGALVNAAGPQAGALGRLAGIALPVGPRKRMTYVFHCREAPGMIPLTIDASGVAFRPEGENYLAIISPPESEDPECHDLELDYRLFEEVIWPALAERVPAFAAIRVVGAWADHYDYNAFDQNAVIGAHPDLANFYFCNGFSGHGFQQAPAAGRAIAELIAHGAYRSLDLSALSYARLVERRPLREVNVV
jgi:sarcosine oxidase